MCHYWINSHSQRHLLFLLPIAWGLGKSTILKCFKHENCLTAKCQNHHLRMRRHVLSMRLVNVLACLGMKLLDKGVEYIDGCSSLTIILCYLGCIKFGQ